MRNRHEMGKINPLIWLALFYCFSRYFLYLKGITFDGSPLYFYWQIIDPILLKNDLWRSIWHLHSQPPLFNLFLGTSLKVFPGFETTVFSIVYKICGLSLCLFMASIMIRLGIPSSLATVVTALYIMTPSVIAYENLLCYEYPVTAALCIAAWACQRFAETKGVLSILTVFICCAVIVFTRSGFTLLWLGLVLLIALYIIQSDFRKTMFAFGLAVLPVLLLYAHNYHQFGFVGTSSWLGMNLTRMTVHGIPKSERLELAAKGEISELSNYAPFQPIPVYKRFLRDDPKTKVPVLDQEFKSNGERNLNHIGYVSLSAQYLEDAVKTAKRYPIFYLKRIGTALVYFFTPSSKYGSFTDSIGKYLPAWEAFYDSFWYCVDPPAFSGKNSPPLCISAVMLYGLVLLFSPLMIRLEGKDPQAVPPLSTSFMWFNVLYVTLVFNSANFGENMRFRLLVEHFAWILMVWILVQCSGMLRHLVKKQ